MKNSGKCAFFLFFFLIITFGIAAAQCPTGDIIIYNQSDVDNFIAAYPNCKELPGNLELRNYETSVNLSGFKNIERIKGDIYVVAYMSDEGFSGMETLTKVDGALKGGGDFSRIVSKGLTGLKELGGIYVGEYSHITCSGLNSLEKVGDITFFGFGSGSFKGLNSLDSIMGNISMNFGSFEGLETLRYIRGRIILKSEPTFGPVTITSCKGLESLQYMGGFKVEGDMLEARFESFEGLESLKEVGSNIEINNTNIRDFSGMELLTKVGGEIIIKNNSELISLGGLQSLDPLGIQKWEVLNNPKLSLCGIESLCSYLDGNGTNNIANNAVDCNSQLEVEEACSNLNCPIENITFDSQEDIENYINMYPFCTEILGSLTIQNAIHNLSSLDNFTTIYGDLIIRNTTILIDCKGLENLITVKGDLIIDNNDALKDLDGLSGLTNMDGAVEVVDNPALSSILSLSGVDYTQLSHITITGNNNLSLCNALSICEYMDNEGINGNHDIYNNASGCLAWSEIMESCGYEVPVICPSGGIDLSSQGAVNNFRFNYPGCTEISGPLYIHGNITDLNGLSPLTSIKGTLGFIRTYQLTNLQGLENLTNVEGDLRIEQNEILASLSGIENIESLSEFITIENNKALSDISSLDRIDLLDLSYLIIRFNENLSACNSNSICNYIHKEGNRGSNKIEFNALGCDSWSEVMNSCGIPFQPYCPPNKLVYTNQYNLDNFKYSFPGCTEISHGLVISGYDNSIYSIDKLIHLTSIKGGLTIQGTNYLRDFSGLNNLEDLGGGMFINENRGLTSLSGLESLRSIGGEFVADSNALLTDITNMNNVDYSTITNLSITDNPKLNICDSKTVKDYLSSGGPFLIERNGPDCSSKGDIVGSESFGTYPNPTSGLMKFNYDQAIVDVEIFNSYGQKLLGKADSRGITGVQLSSLKPGVYRIRVRTVSGEMINHTVVKTE